MGVIVEVRGREPLDRSLGWDSQVLLVLLLLLLLLVLLMFVTSIVLSARGPGILSFCIVGILFRQLLDAPPAEYRGTLFPYCG